MFNKLNSHQHKPFLDSCLGEAVVGQIFIMDKNFAYLGDSRR